MTFVVPFDGSDLAEAALERAVQFQQVREDDILAVSVVPRGNEQFARDQVGIELGESVVYDSVVGRLQAQVHRIAPDAQFRHEAVDEYAPVGTIANRLRRTIRDVDASMVFIGSENAGRIVTTLGSVGTSVAAEGNYDLLIVRSVDD